MRLKIYSAFMEIFFFFCTWGISCQQEYIIMDFYTNIACSGHLHQEQFVHITLIIKKTTTTASHWRKTIEVLVKRETNLQLVLYAIPLFNIQFCFKMRYGDLFLCITSMYIQQMSYTKLRRVIRKKTKFKWRGAKLVKSD